MTPKDGWYWLNTTYACGGIRVADGLIVEACPIYRKWLGKPMLEIIAYLATEDKLVLYTRCPKTNAGHWPARTRQGNVP